MTEFRTEKDSMGEVRVPMKAYYGAQSQRRWRISGQRAGDADARGPRRRAGERARAEVNGAGVLPVPLRRRSPRRQGGSRGNVRRPFVVDVFQTGSGTSTNMNVNEVLANGRTNARKPLGGNAPVTRTTT